MYKVILMGRLTNDPELRTNNETTVCRYTLAVDRNKNETDFISCVAFNKSAEFAHQYFRKGTKVCVCGHIKTGSYTNRDGVKKYTTDVVIESQEFCESKKAEPKAEQNDFQPADDQDLPFH